MDNANKTIGNNILLNCCDIHRCVLGILAFMQKISAKSLITHFSAVNSYRTFIYGLVDKQARYIIIFVTIG